MGKEGGRGEPRYCELKDSFEVTHIQNERDGRHFFPGILLFLRRVPDQLEQQSHG